METYPSSSSQEMESNQLMNTHSLLDNNSMVFSTADLNSGNFQGKTHHLLQKTHTKWVFLYFFGVFCIFLGFSMHLAR